MLPSTPNSSRKRMMCCSNAADHDFDVDPTTRLSKRRQISSPFISPLGCAICMETGLQVVQLGPCSHAVCRSCMTSALLHAFKLQQLPLRCPLPQCKAQLQLQPAVQLLEQQAPGSRTLVAKVLYAAASDLSLIPHHLRCPCPYQDCQVPLEFPDEPLPDVPLDCPSCHRPVCSVCRSMWHNRLTCLHHQALLAMKKTRSGNRHQDTHIQQQQQQQPAHGPCMNPRAAAGAATSVLVCGNHVPSWLQDSQRHSSCCQAAKQQQHTSHAGASGQDAMSWSPAKGVPLHQ